MRTGSYDPFRSCPEVTEWFSDVFPLSLPAQTFVHMIDECFELATVETQVESAALVEHLALSQEVAFWGHGLGWGASHESAPDEEFRSSRPGVGLFWAGLLQEVDQGPKSHQSDSAQTWPTLRAFESDSGEAGLPVLVRI